MSTATPNVAASVRARLLREAKAQGVDFNQVLMRYALKRILYRMTQSPHADRFLLKGALLSTLWYDMPHRPTRDADHWLRPAALLARDPALWSTYLRSLSV